MSGYDNILRRHSDKNLNIVIIVLAWVAVLLYTIRPIGNDSNHHLALYRVVFVGCF